MKNDFEKAATIGLAHITEWLSGGKREGDEYTALNPTRADKHAGSFRVNLKSGAWADFATGDKGGDAVSLYAFLHGMKQGDAAREILEEYDPSFSIQEVEDAVTLDDYASAKKLPLAFLKKIGLETIYFKKAPAVKFPYYNEAGDEVACRFRLALHGDNRFRWRKGSRVMLYGLWRLKSAQKSTFVYTFEGESDTQTAWLFGLPALGVPGATTWRREWAPLLEGLTIYVWQEPGAGGVQFRDSIGASIPDARIIEAPEGTKDISEAHVRGDDVPALLERLRATARPFREIEAERLAAEASEARTAAAPILALPNVLDAFARAVAQAGLVAETKNAKILFLALSSRILSRPISIIIKGPSSAGKNTMLEFVIKFFPESAVYALSSMSERALAYSQEPLKHRFLIVYEFSGMNSDFASYLLRSLLSEGRIRYETVEKTSEGLMPKLIEREGPTGTIITTTAIKIHPENETRIFSLTADDSTNQTAAIMSELAGRMNGKQPEAVDFTLWIAFQKWLELEAVKDVSIPYAQALAEGANAKAIRLRRDFTSVLNLIAIHAIVHQKHRKLDALGRVIATSDDYRAIFDLIIGILNEGVALAVPATIRETVKAVGELHAAKGAPVTIKELYEHLGIDRSVASRRVSSALSGGYLKNLEEKRGRPLKLEPGDPLPADENVLPDPVQVCACAGGDKIPPPCAEVQKPYDRAPKREEGGKKDDQGGGGAITPRTHMHTCTPPDREAEVVDHVFGGLF
ncbi:MAG: hypothetical protein JXD23_08070 [Spirochaetales bacterium]|nr:hypothetical protein [Spirochaetales bacterium]